MAKSVRKEAGLLLKHSSIYGMASVVNRFLGFLMIPIYTTYLTPEDYGVMELLYTTTSFVSMVVGIGIANGIARFYYESDVLAERNMVISSAFVGLGMLLLPVIGLLVATSHLFALYVLDSTDYTRFFVIAFVTMGLGILQQIGGAYFRTVRKSLLLTSTSLGQLLINLSLNIYFIVALDMGVWGVFLSNFIATSAAVVVIIPFILRHVGLKVSWNIIRELVVFGLPLIPSNVATYVVVASDRFFIKEYVSMAQAGIYSLGYKFGILITNFVTNPFNQIYGPRRYELFKQEGSGQLFSRIFTYFMFAQVFCGMAISVIAKDVVQIVADEAYWDAYKIIPLVTLAHIFLSFFSHFSIGITYEKKTKYFAYINIMNAILNIGLNIILIKRYGMWGAASATLICYIFRSSMTFYFSNRLHKIYVEWQRVVFLLVSAFGYYLLLVGLDVSGNLLNLALKAVLLLTYPLALYVMRFFTIQEAQYLKEMLSKPRDMLNRSRTKEPPVDPAADSETSTDHE